MKRFVCLLLALAILLPGAAALADPEEWEYQSNGDYTIRYPDYMNIYSVLKEEYGWDMDVLESAAETGEEEFSVVILYAGMDDWLSWLETGSFPDIRGNMEKMGRVEVDEPPVDIRTGMETTFAQYMSADGKRMREVWIFDADEGDLDRVVICRWAADADGFYEDIVHWMMETLTFDGDPGPSGGPARSGARGSFSVVGVWNYDGVHKVIKDVVVDRKSAGMYWIYVTSDVTKFKVEKLTWNDRTFKVKNAKQLYANKKLTTTEVIAIHDWLPEMLPNIRIRAVNSDGIEEIWYVSTNEENGEIILLSEAEMSY